MKKRRIRIHQKTLKLMNSPEYIYIWVNPDDMEIAICNADKSSKDALKIHSGHECEIYSTFLFSKLKKTAPCLKENRTYKLAGILSRDNRVARFSLIDSNVI